jgi:hypothetical protein
MQGEGLDTETKEIVDFILREAERLILRAQERLRLNPFIIIEMSPPMGMALQRRA